MVKLNVHSILTSIKQQVENSPVDEVIALLGEALDVKDSQFANALGTDGLAALQDLAKQAGVAYTGKSLDLWKGEDSVGCRLPSVYSDGVDAVLDWGGQTAKLTGKLPPVLGLDVRFANDAASIRVGLRVAYETAEQKEVIQEQLLDMTEWAEVVPLLKVVAPFLGRKDLFSGEIKSIQVLEFTKREGVNGEYWLLTGKTGEKVFKFSLPIEATFAKGDIVSVNHETSKMVVNGVEYGGGGFHKMGDLEIGKLYTGTEVQANTGKFPGYNITVKGLGFATANSQFTRWYEGSVLAMGEVISVQNPVQFTVESLKQTKDGKTIAKLSISMPSSQSVGLAALMSGGQPMATATVVPMQTPVAPAQPVTVGKPVDEDPEWV